MAVTTARRLDGYTLDDWESLEPAEGHRVELVDGRFVVNAAPSVRRRRVADRLCRLLDDAVAPEGMEALTAVGVRIREGLAYIPDVVVATERVETTSVDVDTVALVAEVVSPSTKKTDRLEKPAAFAAAGVPACGTIVEQFFDEEYSRLRSGEGQAAGVRQVVSGVGRS